MFNFDKQSMGAIYRRSYEFLTFLTFPFTLCGNYVRIDVKFLFESRKPKIHGIKF